MASQTVVKSTMPSMTNTPASSPKKSSPKSRRPTASARTQNSAESAAQALVRLLHSAWAWNRPNSFRKVLSIVGSFTNIRGGHQYPDIVAKEKKKPIRVFLCDGRNDLRGVRDGKYDATWDWYLQNVRMKDALTKKGYDLNYTWGINNHGGSFGGQILPDMMRWLWRDAQPDITDPNDQIERSLRTPGLDH